MFEAQTKALRQNYPRSAALFVIVAPTVNDAVRFGGRLNLSFSAVSYETLSPIRGESFTGAILLDPPGDKVLVPNEVLMSLATAAMLTEVKPHDLVKVYRNGKEATESLYDSSKWWCNTCTCIRQTNPCWKCGTADGHHPLVGTPDLNTPSITEMRAIAHPLGWVLAEHGSKERDLDVVAVAWTEDACSIDNLIEALAKGMETPNGPTHVFEPGLKPHGRIAYNIQLNGWYKIIDLSVANGGWIK